MGLKQEVVQEIKIYNKELVVAKRLDFVKEYQLLAIEAVTQPGPNPIQGSINGLFEFVCFNSNSSLSIIDNIKNGNIQMLAYMASEFLVLATVHDREDLIEKAPLSVSVDEIRIRQTLPTENKIEEMGQ